MEVALKKLFISILFLNLAFFAPAQAVDYVNGKTIAGCALLGVGIYNALQAIHSFDGYNHARAKLKKDIQTCHIGMASKFDHYREKSSKALVNGIKSTLYALATSITATVLLKYGLLQKS